MRRGRVGLDRERENGYNGGVSSRKCLSVIKENKY